MVTTQPGRLSRVLFFGLGMIQWNIFYLDEIKEVIINYTRPGKGTTHYLEGLVDEDPVRKKPSPCYLRKSARNGAKKTDGRMGKFH
jgi:hypothetical protein